MTTANDNLVTYSGEIADKAIKQSAASQKNPEGNEYVEIRIMQDDEKEMTARAWDEQPIADLKSIKRGEYVLIGCRDVPVKDNPGSFYHNVVWVNLIDRTGSPAPAQNTSTPEPTTRGITHNEEWTPSLNLRIAWNSAVNNAVNAEPIDADPFGENTKGRLPLHIWLENVDTRANGLYPLILRGPVAPVEEAEEVEEEEPAVDDVIGGVMEV